MRGQGRILLADDEETFLLSTADLLRKEGFDCDCAKDSESATTLIEKNQYDLLIADIKMPGNAELEFIHDLPEKAKGLPVILVTGYPSLKSAILSVQLPVFAYLIKPINFDELTIHVRTVMKRAQVRNAVLKARQNLQTWRVELDNIEQIYKMEKMDASLIPIDAFMTLTLQNIVNSLSDLKTLAEVFAGLTDKNIVCNLTNCPRLNRLNAGIKEAIIVLEESRKSFKSNELGNLRARLKELIQNEDI